MKTCKLCERVIMPGDGFWRLKALHDRSPFVRLVRSRAGIILLCAICIEQVATLAIDAMTPPEVMGSDGVDR